MTTLPQPLRGGFSKADSIPAGRVQTILKRWQAWDPDDNTETNASERTGLSTRWFYSLRAGSPDRMIPFDAVDRIVTHLGLQDEWPFLMDEEEPGEMVARHCASCKSNVLAEPGGKHPCGWCGKRTFKPKPEGWVRPFRHPGPRFITPEQLDKAWHLYFEREMSMPEVAQEMFDELGYCSLMSAERMLRHYFHQQGWVLRRVLVSGPQIGSQWRCCTEELLQEGRLYYEQGYSMKQVINILWPRLGYRTKETAAGVFYTAFESRGWPRRDQRELTRERNTKHGRASNPDKLRAGDPGYERLAEYHREKNRESYYRDRQPCKHPGCKAYAGGKEHSRSPKKVPKGDPDYCKRHDSNAKRRRAEGMQLRADRHHRLVSDVQHILDAWNIRPAADRALSEAAGVPRMVVYRMFRAPEGQYARRENVDAIERVGLPPANYTPMKMRRRRKDHQGSTV